MSTPVIIDANSLIKRCIMASALEDLKAGEVWTGGVYGTLTMLRTFLDDPDLEPGPIYAFFDNGTPENRLALIPYYKEGRVEKRKLLTDEEKVRAFTQMHLARLMLEKLGVLCVAYRDREADDAVAAAVRVLAAEGYESVVWSSDTDLLQTVSMGARVYNGSRWITSENFEDEIGVPIETYNLYKVLVGKPSDSIPGAAGVGPKRGAEIIEEMKANLVYLSPVDQLTTIRKALADKKKLRKFEQSIIDDLERLKDVALGKDLSNSFGGTDGLRRRMAEHKPEVRRMDFLRFCKKLKFASVTGSPNQYLRPFEDAARRA